MKPTTRLTLALLAVTLYVAATPPARAQGEPRMPTFDLEALDPSVDPCEDLYQYACGGWHAKNPMPPDESFWSRPFRQFSNQIDGFLRSLIEEAAQGSSERTPDEQKIGDHFASCMDTAAIEARGLRPLGSELALIDGMTAIEDLPVVLGTLLRQTSLTFWEAILLTLRTEGDPAEGGQAKRIWIETGNDLGLPGRDYYLEKDEESEVLREQYRGHVAQMLGLLGATSATAGEYAGAILALETRLVEARLPNSVLRNDPAATSNSMTLEELQSLTPRFHWADFLRALGVATSERLNVTEPAYLERFDALLAETPLKTWQAFLRFHVVSNRAGLLPQGVRDAWFDFNSRILRGREVPRPRWQTCVWHVERVLGDPMGRLFVDRAFRPEMRARTLAIFEEIKSVMHGRIESVDWMAPETKKEAIAKLDAVRLSAGHPDRWLDDRRVVIRRDDFYGNTLRASVALRRVAFQGLGQPLDLNQWKYPPSRVVGYQLNKLNAIVIAAGYLLLLEDPTHDLGVLYGGLGTLLAHELTHGYDPLGREYDAAGRLRDWWTAGDAKRFDERAQCVAEQFSAFEYAPGIPLDGSFLVSEQVAELSSVSIAWEAYQNALEGQALPDLGGVSSAQRFFLTNAQIWCIAATDSQWRDLATGDSHAWGAPGVNGTVLNLPEFAEAFGCRAGQAMVKPPQEVCKVW